MIKYIEINYEDFLFIKDKSGYYCVKHFCGLDYYKDRKYHREDGPAFICKDGDKYYYLNGKYYGNDNIYTDESWTKFCKLKAFY